MHQRHKTDGFTEQQQYPPFPSGSGHKVLPNVSHRTLRIPDTELNVKFNIENSEKYRSHARIKRRSRSWEIFNGHHIMIMLFNFNFWSYTCRIPEADTLYCKKNYCRRKSYTGLCPAAWHYHIFELRTSLMIASGMPMPGLKSSIVPAEIRKWYRVVLRINILFDSYRHILVWEASKHIWWNPTA